MDPSVEILTVLLSAVSEDVGACIAQAGMSAEYRCGICEYKEQPSPNEGLRLALRSKLTVS